MIDLKKLREELYHKASFNGRMLAANWERAPMSPNKIETMIDALQEAKEIIEYWNSVGQSGPKSYAWLQKYFGEGEK